jgi:ABC-type anion transport system duplicated permease subunit
VTGAITTAGGACNASIVAEAVSWDDTKITAHSLGAYIADNMAAGDYPKIVLGIAVMSASANCERAAPRCRTVRGGARGRSPTDRTPN